MAEYNFDAEIEDIKDEIRGIEYRCQELEKMARQFQYNDKNWSERPTLQKRKEELERRLKKIQQERRLAQYTKREEEFRAAHAVVLCKKVDTQTFKIWLLGFLRSNKSFMDPKSETRSSGMLERAVIDQFFAAEMEWLQANSVEGEIKFKRPIMDQLNHDVELDFSIMIGVKDEDSAMMFKLAHGGD